MQDTDLATSETTWNGLSENKVAERIGIGSRIV